MIKPSFILIVVILVAAEIFAHLFFANNVQGHFTYGYGTDDGIVEKPDGTVDLVKTGGREFRPQSFLKERKLGVNRIFVVGDSVPRGPSLETAYPFLLGPLLEKKGIPAESYNFAVAGYSARRCQLVVKQALRYNPTLIIYHLNWTDEHDDEREYQRSQEFQSWAPSHWPMKLFILRRLYEFKLEQIYWQWLPMAIRERASANDADAKVNALRDSKTQQRWINLVKAKAAETIQLIHQQHVAVLIVTQCHYDRDTKKMDDPPLDDFGRSQIAPGIGFLSMKEALQGADDEKIFSGGSHLHPEGQEILAKAIVEACEQQNLLIGHP